MDEVNGTITVIFKFIKLEIYFAIKSIKLALLYLTTTSSQIELKILNAMLNFADKR